jgi:hypothetical protein|tara:strand:+ start:517 stop:1860 length:1344 start_codon:yes stop_codon:yes gene_type:complete
METKGTSKTAETSSITKLEITSNKDENKKISLLGGTNAPGPRLFRMMYYESILQDTIKAEVIFVDTGGAVDGKSAIEGLPLVGTEEVDIAFQDNQENKIKLKMYVNKVTPIDEDTRKSSVQLNMVSEEFIRNEEGNSRLNVRFDGRISDHITKILKSFLKTKKKLDIENTSNNYNFIGNNRKPYYALNWLSKTSIPENAGKKGSSAGFFFFETSEGFKFKSIDGLFAQEKKKSFIYNETPDSNGKVPSGYNGKILSQQADNAIDAQSKFQMGAYSTRLVIFDPYTCNYQVIKQTADETKSGTKLGGKDLPTFNKKFDTDFTRTTYMLADTGTLPSGSSSQQISKAKEQNFETPQVLNQAIRRYNQMFAGMQTITIAGDFSLHAGDVVFIDTPGRNAEKNDQINKEYGGLYIIADLCHYISTKETYTKLNLVRDSFGRKGNHTTNIPL